jgi:hypothetical protein
VREQPVAVLAPVREPARALEQVPLPAPVQVWLASWAGVGGAAAQVLVWLGRVPVRELRLLAARALLEAAQQRAVRLKPRALRTPQVQAQQAAVPRARAPRQGPLVLQLRWVPQAVPVAALE